MDLNLLDAGYECPTIAGSLFDYMQYSIDKKLGCIRTDGKICCMSLCANGYRCQREASIQIPLATIQHEDVECSKYLTSGTSENKSKPDNLLLCARHAKVFETSTVEKPFSYLTWAIKEGAVIVCKSLAAILVSEGIKAFTGLPMSSSFVTAGITTGASILGGTINAKIVEPKLKKALN